MREEEKKRRRRWEGEEKKEGYTCRSRRARARTVTSPLF